MRDVNASDYTRFALQQFGGILFLDLHLVVILLALYTRTLWIFPFCLQSQKWHRFGMWWLKSVYEKNHKRKLFHQQTKNKTSCTHTNSSFNGCTTQSLVSSLVFLPFLSPRCICRRKLPENRVRGTRCDRAKVNSSIYLVSSFVILVLFFAVARVYFVIVRHFFGRNLHRTNLYCFHTRNRQRVEKNNKNTHKIAGAKIRAPYRKLYTQLCASLV